MEKEEIMRISKTPEERKTEILDAAEHLFTTKGYSETTVNDILKIVGVAKGTFYYYFPSKEEVMHAIVERFIDVEVQRAEAIASNTSLKAPDKIFQIMMTPSSPEQRKDNMIEELHGVGNAEMHQKSIIETIKQLTPILTKIIEQGISENVFTTPYPQETVEVLLVSSGFIFDDGIFKWEPNEQMQKAKAFIYILETVLGAKEGSFQYLLERLGS